MNYKQALEYIHNTNKFGIKLGLENMKNLLDILDNPQTKLKFIHIAGTNGKGSISSLLNGVLKAQGYKVGLFTSPYLEEFTERIKINEKNMQKEELAKLTLRVKEAIDEMTVKGLHHPTEFEIVTAIALLYFFQNQVDIVILEVGLGGRLDATNIIPNSELTIITSIGKDHTQYLGNTLKEIAIEKANIIKRNSSVVVYPQSDEINNEIKEIADERNAGLFLVNINNVKPLESSIEGQSFSYESGDLNLPKVEIKLLGGHQIYNTATALKAIEVLKEKGYKISKDAILKGLKNTSWPGRFEIISKQPTVILDGAHNPQGAKAFYNAFKKYFPNKKAILFLGLLGDKDIDEILELLLPIAKEVITLTPNNPRAIKAEVLANKIKTMDKSLKVTSMNSANRALNYIKNMDKEEITVFMGSLYLVGEVRRVWNQSRF